MAPKSTGLHAERKKAVGDLLRSWCVCPKQAAPLKPGEALRMDRSVYWPDLAREGGREGGRNGWMDGGGMEGGCIWIWIWGPI